MNRSAVVLWAVGLMSAHSLLVLLQAVAAYMDHVTEIGGLTRAVGRVLLICAVTWAVLQGRRWAWWVATVVGGVLTFLAFVGLLALGAAAAFGEEDVGPALLPFGALSALLLAGSAISLAGAFCALVVGLAQAVPAPGMRVPARLIGAVPAVAGVAVAALALAAITHSTRSSSPAETAGARSGGSAPVPSESRPGQSSRPGPGRAGTALPDGFGAVAVDGAGGRVFVSSPKSGAVSVLDLEGRLVHTIGGVPGAGSLLVDGDRLYVASTTGGRIDVFDAATFQLLGRFGEGTLVGPGPLVKAGGRLWTSTGPCGRHQTALVSMDPATGAATVHPPITSLRYCVALTASPVDPNLLLGFEPGLSPATIVVLDVSGPSPVELASRRQERLSNLRQLAFLPGGDRFVAASGAPYTFLEFRTADLVESGVEYPAEPYPSSVSTTPASGGMVAAGIDSTSEDPDVFVFRAGDPERRLATFDLGPSRSLMERGLAWTPDGSSLLAVSGDVGGADISFHVLDL